MKKIIKIFKLKFLLLILPYFKTKQELKKKTRELDLKEISTKELIKSLEAEEIRHLKNKIEIADKYKSLFSKN